MSTRRGKPHSSLNLKSLGSIEVEGKTIAISSLFEIDEEDLDREYREQSALYAYFITKTSEADDLHAQAVTNKELVYAQADEYFRSKFRDLGIKVTEKGVESSIIQDEEYGEALDKERKTKLQHTILKGIVRAMEQRANMLISLGAHRRAELDMTNMTINRTKHDDDVGELKTRLRRMSKKR